MKNIIHVNTLLYVGVLSFNIFSSCSSTKESLGIGSGMIHSTGSASALIDLPSGVTHSTLPTNDTTMLQPVGMDLATQSRILSAIDPTSPKPWIGIDQGSARGYNSAFSVYIIRGGQRYFPPYDNMPRHMPRPRSRPRWSNLGSTRVPNPAEEGATIRTPGIASVNHEISDSDEFRRRRGSHVQIFQFRQDNQMWDTETETAGITSIPSSATTEPIATTSRPTQPTTGEPDTTTAEPIAATSTPKKCKPARGGDLSCYDELEGVWFIQTKSGREYLPKWVNIYDDSKYDGGRLTSTTTAELDTTTTELDTTTAEPIAATSTPKKSGREYEYEYEEYLSNLTWGDIYDDSKYDGGRLTSTTTAEPIATTSRPTQGTTAKPDTTTAKSIATRRSTKPTTAKPTTAKPTTAKPTTAKPTTAKPTTAKPTTAKPIATTSAPKKSSSCTIL